MRAIRDLPPEPMETAPVRGRPVRPAFRVAKAYWVTFVVVASYAWIRLTARFRSEDGYQQALVRRHLRNARRINLAIQEMQGLYIKVGQLLSILTNFLPAEFRGELEGLQDRVAPRPYPDIERRLLEELGGRNPREVFAEFDERPVASASIAQVHRARLKSGEPVAVKVQYPDIEAITEVDLRALRFIFRVIGKLLPYEGMDSIYEEVRVMLLQELDFLREAESMERVEQNFRGRNDVGFPHVFREFTTQRLLVTSWVEGIKVADTARLDEAGVDREVLARLVVEAYCKQIFTDGLYHADPHPGNILVQPGPPLRIVFIDFGAIAEVSPSMRQGLVDIIQGALTRDTTRVAQALRTMGFAARTADPRIFERIVDYFHQRFQEEIQLESLNLRDLKFDPKKGLRHLADLRRMEISLRDITASFHVPRQWILLERTLLLLMGLCTALAPKMNPMDVIQPYLEEFVLGKDRDPSKLVFETTRDVALSAVALPGEIRKFLTYALRGDLELRMRGVEEGAQLVYSGAQQLVYTLLGITGLAAAHTFDGRGHSRLTQIALIGAGICGLLLVASMLTTRARLRRRR